MRTATRILFFCLFAFLVQASFAQSDSTKAGKEKNWWKKGKPYVIVTNDGTEYIGEVVGDNDREVLIMTKTMGKLYIPKYSIKTIELLESDNFANGQYIDENNHRNYYIAATNALPFKKGEMRMSMYYFGGFSGTYSLNENVALGLHTTIIGAPMAISLKTSFLLSDKSYIGTDIHVGSLTYLQRSSYVGSIAAKYTSGNEKTNFSLMGGIGFASILQYKYIQTGPYGGTQQSYHENDNSYFFNASFFHRLTKNAGFAAEGWVVPKAKFGLLGIGIRTFRKKDMSWVFGFYNLIYQSNQPYYSNGYYNQSSSPVTSFIPIPYFGANFKL
ncbi:MAG: hypothetical protein K0S33_1572 [Bacteroidetes bacterium]|jgi:hypothetical protein|nr:hypothetical protein [Bacteroidota bacterium]